MLPDSCPFLPQALTTSPLVEDGTPATDELPVENTGPISHSLPAALRNSGVTHRFAHLQPQRETRSSPTRKERRDEKEGKRRIRREDNARFVDNPHIVQATKKDYEIVHQSNRTTFPDPLPSYLPRNTKAPSPHPPIRDPISASAGRFSLSLKGLRRDLRRAGGRAEKLVFDVEEEIMGWLREDAVIFSPDSISDDIDIPGTPVGTSQSILEVSRTPLRLVWCITDDGFARYVVHCCARYHEVVSFSRESSGRRLTYLLKPNVTRPDYHAATSLFTPPVTDLDYSSHGVESDSDLVSDVLSDFEDVQRPLSALSEQLEDLGPRPPQGSYREKTPDWSVIGDVEGEADIDDDEPAHYQMLSQSIESLTLGETTSRAALRCRSGAVNVVGSAWDRRSMRSASSPSRSPVRRPAKNVQVLLKPVRKMKTRSFYNYLFS